MSKDGFGGFPADCTKFLAELAANNRREWFQANKKRFEASAQAPALALVRAMAPRLRKISPHLVADDRKSGGSMMRIYRDTRFSKDRRPYNAHLRFQFRHEAGKGNVAPGYFLGIEPGKVVVGAGIWQPETALANRIRAHIDGEQRAWKRARDAKAFRDAYGGLEGESLKRPPKGYDKDHPLLEDLKRKDFVAFAKLPMKSIRSVDFPDTAARSYKAAQGFMKFLCAALDVPW